MRGGAGEGDGPSMVTVPASASIDVSISLFNTVIYATEIKCFKKVIRMKVKVIRIY